MSTLFRLTLTLTLLGFLTACEDGNSNPRPGTGTGDDGPIDTSGGGTTVPVDAIQTGVDCSQAVTVPFGSHMVDYTSGIIMPSGEQGDLDATVINVYDTWKSTYVGGGSPCAADEYYVKAGLEDSFVVSEGQGYGMLIMAYMAGYDPEAQTIFDGMYRFVQSHPSSKSDGLLAWSQDSQCNSNEGITAATDGDMDVAYALLLADKQWGSNGSINYLAEAQALIAEIELEERHEDDNWFLVGDWVLPGGRLTNSTRSSDFMPGHLDAFALASGDSSWSATRGYTYNVFKNIQTNHSTTTGLIPDFIEKMAEGGEPATPGLLESNDDSYGWNACRVPWRLGVHYLVTGNSDAKQILDKINGWIVTEASSKANNVAPGYTLDGSPLNTGWFSMAFIAPFGVSAMLSSSNQAWLDSIWNLASSPLAVAYYDDSIRVLSMIAMSGNWWAPEQITCN